VRSNEDSRLEGFPWLKTTFAVATEVEHLFSDLVQDWAMKSLRDEGRSSSALMNKALKQSRPFSYLMLHKSLRLHKLHGSTVFLIDAEKDISSCPSVFFAQSSTVIDSQVPPVCNRKHGFQPVNQENLG